jgi:peptidoglycan hydrolase-like protein with peptidoglycan-binding domain
MSGKNLNILISLLILISLSGCATLTEKQKPGEFRALKKRVSFLEAEIKNKDSEIDNLTNELDRERVKSQDLLKALKERKQGRKEKERILAQAKRKTYYYFVIRIQTALKKAGFSPGLIDGSMGSRTRAAIKNFQKANGLPADGCVDKQTWTLLRKHL